MITAATILFIVLAAAFKAVADTLFHHYDTSIFQDLKRVWWDPNTSWAYVKFLPGTKYRPDAWHLANTGMIICFCAAVAIHRPLLPWYLELLVAGVLFNFVFNLFYNKILR